MIFRQDKNKAMLLGFRAPEETELRSIDMLSDLCDLLDVPKSKRLELSNYITPLAKEVLKNKQDMDPNDPKNIQYIRNMILSVNMRASSIFFSFSPNKLCTWYHKKTMRNKLYQILPHTDT
jgi:hypothetical protein